MFEIYRSRQNPEHYVAVQAGDTRANAVGVRNSPNLSFLASVAEEGDPRIAFDPHEASIRIARDAFYAFAVKVRVREHPA